MSALQRARIKPRILQWAREQSHYTVAVAAKKIGVSAEALAAWEAGEAQPTVKQLRNAARIYRYSLAVFFLPEPPGDAFKPIRDYRRFAGVPATEISPELHLAIREAHNRRESALELYQLLDEQPPEFAFSVSLSDDPEAVGTSLRDYLGITADEQLRWREPRNSFPAVRGKLEAHGVLVFQVSRIATEEMRGFAISERPLPAVVANRGDAAAGRLFSLMHETAHLALRSAGICNVSETEALRDEGQDVEVFCNQVAAATLVPLELFRRQPTVRAKRGEPWRLQDLEGPARTFAVSRYVIARRLLTIGAISQPTYERLVDELAKEFAGLPKPKGYLSPAQNVVSLGGNVLPALVLEAFGRDRISASTVASYLGVQLKHVPDIRHAIDRTP